MQSARADDRISAANYERYSYFSRPRRDNTSGKSIRRRIHCNASGVVLNVSLVLGSLPCRISGIGPN